jgi:hypothetical protein
VETCFLTVGFGNFRPKTYKNMTQLYGTLLIIILIVQPLKEPDEANASIPAKP